MDQTLPADFPNPANEWTLPHRHIGGRVLFYDEIDSTNTRAAQLADDAQRHGWVLVAERQSAGRGQYGRVWECPPGQGLLLSVLLFPPPDLRRPAVMTALAAVAVAETILQCTTRQAKIKWPNDVLLNGKKVCGILLESGTRPEANSLPYLVMGIGLNVNQTQADFEARELPHAGSLVGITGVSLSTADVLRTLLQNLDAEWELLRQGEITTLEACWKWRVGLLGRPVIVERMDGTHVAGRLREMAFSGIELVQPNGVVLTLPPEAIRHVWGEDTSTRE